MSAEQEKQKQQAVMVAPQFYYTLIRLAKRVARDQLRREAVEREQSKEATA